MVVFTTKTRCLGKKDLDQKKPLKTSKMMTKILGKSNPADNIAFALSELHKDYDKFIQRYVEIDRKPGNQDVVMDEDDVTVDIEGSANDEQSGNH